MRGVHLHILDEVIGDAARCSPKFSGTSPRSFDQDSLTESALAPVA